MLSKKDIKQKPYRIVIVTSLLILLLVEIYVVLVQFHTVNVSSFDVEVVGNTAIINESEKTFSINNYNGDFIKISKEYKKVLDVSWNYVAVIDTDNQLKIIDFNENILITFNNFSLDLSKITTVTLIEEQDVIKVSFIENKNEKNISIDYCYNKDTKETYIIRN